MEGAVQALGLPALPLLGELDGARLRPPIEERRAEREQQQNAGDAETRW